LFFFFFFSPFCFISYLYDLQRVSVKPKPKQTRAEYTQPAGRPLPHFSKWNCGVHKERPDQRREKRREMVYNYSPGLLYDRRSTKCQWSRNILLKYSGARSADVFSEIVLFHTRGQQQQQLPSSSTNSVAIARSVGIITL
jgi:hypothetical protein